MNPSNPEVRTHSKYPVIIREVGAGLRCQRTFYRGHEPVRQTVTGSIVTALERSPLARKLGLTISGKNSD